MVTNSKVLTVSYGTFSCTLEGFDESFDTMKSIAEYFRDLAADDRYFGAEPPTPDAEMLARIAEREIERRVQVRTDQGAIYLSAATPDAAEAPAEATEKAENAAETVAAPIPAEAPAETVSEDSEISDAAQDALVEAEAPEAEEVEVEDVTDAILDAVTAPEVAEDVAEADEAIIEPENTEPEVDAPIMEDAASEEVLLEGILEEDDLDDVSEAEEVSEVLAEADENDAEVAVEDVADDAEAETELDLSRITAALEMDDTPVVERVESVVEDVAEAAIEEPIVLDELQDTLGDADTDGESAAEILAPASAEEDPQFDEDSIAAKLRRIRAVVSRVEALPEDDDFSEDEHAGNVMGDVDEEEESDDLLTLSDPIEMLPVEDAPVAETPKPVRARILRMKKSDFEQAKASGQLLEAEPFDDEDDDDLPETPVAEAAVKTAPAESSLTPEAEAELLAELAQVEAELKGDRPVDVEPVLEDTYIEDLEDENPTETERMVRAQSLSDVSPTTEEGVARLLAEADQQFEEPEGSRRRNAIAHLRAAVAATKAEKGHEKDSVDDAAVYRDDLASVVQPLQRAPQPPAKPVRPSIAASAAKAAAREATPLKLVAEQRIDTASEAPQKAETPQRDPVRPRRVSAADRMERHAVPAAPVGTSVAEADSFNDFVAQTGARSLPDILEAAAAYLTFVEGHPRFSRPMVMRLARDLDEDNFSREDGLRGFGQLLRDNKIEKLEGGRFTASDLIRYKPEDRAVG